jgi:threonine/homoserine/homoserine lactone efflux protein
VGALAAGVVAGLGIAVPVGPIAILLVDLSVRRGFRRAVPAALGAASADLFYASVAALVGLAAARLIEPYGGPLRAVSVGVLFAIVAYRIRTLLLPGTGGPASPRRRDERGLLRTYASFLGVTLLNPITVAYFAALIVGLQDGVADDAAGKALFVAGAGGASAAWQLLLVGAGGLLHRRLPERAVAVTGWAGNLLIAAFALRLGLAP